MDKRQSDHIDNRIRQAAEGVSPPFNEAAWKKMEELLDGEFTTRKPRRFLWWWFVLLVLLGGLAVYYLQHEPGVRQDDEIAGGNNTVTGAFAPGQQEEKPENGVQNTPGTTLKLQKDKVPAQSPKESLPSELRVPNAMSRVRATAKAGATTRSKQVEIARASHSAGKKKVRTAEKGIITPYPREKVDANEGTRQQLPDGDDGTAKNDASERRTQKEQTLLDTPADSRAQTPVKLDSSHIAVTPAAGSTATTATPPTAKNVDSSLSHLEPAPGSPVVNATVLAPVRLQGISRLYFTGSIAPDASALKGSPLNNIGTVYGAGIGYRLTKRWNVQAGLYAGKKIYVAGPSDYKVKPGSYWSMVDIIKINADCYIIDIPVSVRYDLIKKPKYNVYAVAGISSILMKSENYDYHYMRNGVYHQSALTYTGNNHLFSVVNVSAGFERKISTAFYIQAEPYIKVPLSGIGEGKVKLHSAGLQLGLKYQPFRHKK